MRYQIQRAWSLGLIALATASCDFPRLPVLADGGPTSPGEPDGGATSPGESDGDATGGDGPDRGATSDGEPDLFTLELLAGDIRGIGYTDGIGAAARFHTPLGTAVDSDGSTYVADTENHTIRKIAPDGAVTTLAGSPGQIGIADGIGAAARFHAPRDVAVDSAGNVYVADRYNHTIRKVSPTGVVITLAGGPGRAGSEDGMGIRARFYEPGGVAVDGAGNVYVADTSNLTIRKVTATGVVTTLAGQQACGEARTVSGRRRASTHLPAWQWTAPATSMLLTRAISPSAR